MKIADGLEILKLRRNAVGTAGLLNPTLIWDEYDAILVDAGLPRQIQNIREELASYDIETVICYHGGIFNKNANERIAELANV